MIFAKFGDGPLLPGRVYESINFGIVEYVGVDSFCGEQTHKFNTTAGAKHWKTHQLGSFLVSTTDTPSRKDKHQDAAELRPCPFCGNPPKWKADMYLHQILHCEECRLEVRADPAIAFIYTKNADKRERDQITKIWNGRSEVGIPATNSETPPAYNGCVCSCHRGTGKIHFVACCTPPAPVSREASE